MLSKLRNFFGSKSNNGEREFQQRVCAIVEQQFPDTKVTPSDDPLMIEVGETQLGLSNIIAKFNAGSRTDDDLIAIVKEHFLAFVESKKNLDSGSPDWETARSILMPRLVSRGQFGEMPVLLSPFCGDVQIAFVLDSERVMQYVSDEVFISWEKNIKEILDIALSNLEDRSADIAATAIPGTMVAISTMDSFDAARILSPRIREVIAETVGSPFCFGVPNRDFLVCWPKNADASEMWGNQVKIDFKEQPYPISDKVYECDDQGDITVTN